MRQMQTKRFFCTLPLKNDDETAHFLFSVLYINTFPCLDFFSFVRTLGFSYFCIK